MFELEEVNDRVGLFEQCLVKLNLKVIILLDEFQLVYSMPPQIGAVIVDEVAALSGTNAGTIHMIVSGSGAILRKLVFNKTRGLDISEYPSFNRTDLNSTKLHPRWIFPLRDPSDISNFYRMYGYANSNHVMNFIFSGGRPGIMIKENLEGPQFSVSPNFNTTMKALYDCVSSVIEEREHVEIELMTTCSQSTSCNLKWESLCSPLIMEPFEYVYLRARVFEPNLTLIQFEANCYDLVDSGDLIFTNNTSLLGFSSFTAYEIVKSTKNYHLTWKEAAALKYPFALFDNLAERTILKVIRRNHNKINIFGGSIVNTDESSLELNAPKSNDSLVGVYYFLTEDISLIINKLHKELFDGNDNCGADAIFIEQHAGSENDYNVCRCQIKLKNGSIDNPEVEEIQRKMQNDGGKVIDNIRKRLNVVRWVNILLTTQFYKGADINFQAGISTEFDCKPAIVTPEFRFLSHVDLLPMWPDGVKQLGKPYATSSKLFENTVSKDEFHFNSIE